MPTRRGQPVRIEGRDLETGYKFFEGTFDPPAPDQLLVLPPDIHRDFEAPTPILGSPIRFYVLTPAGAESKEIAPGLTMDFTPATGGQGSLEVSGQAGTVQAGVQIRLLGLENQVNQDVRATAAGSFTLAASVEAGKRYLIAIGAVIGATDDLTVAFSEGLPEEVPGIEVRDAGGRDPRPIIEPLGTTETVRIEPVVGWRAGERYTLRLTPELVDAAGNSWNRTLSIEFEVEASEVLDTLGLAAVRDVARLGSLLFVAADTKGLAVIDASDPTDLKHLVPGDITFPLPLNDPVHGVTVDPHGRVLVVGGGVTGFGQIKIFDPQALDPAAVAANPNDPAVLFAAFKGVSIISDRNSGVGTSLPEGTPRKVSVLSDDQTDRWRAGKDEPPAGFNVIPITAPPGGGEFTVTVEGEGWRVNRPVTLRNVTRGSWKRVDTDVNGDFQVEIRAYAGDRLELVRNRDSIAYVATLGVGVISVDVNAFYNEDPANPPDPGAQSFESDVIGIYTGFEDGLELCGTPTSDVGTMVDLGVMFDPGNAHPMTIAGLVGLRGLLLLESPPMDIGEMFYFNDLCLNIEGSQQVWGLELAQDYPFDADRDGVYADDEYRDYLLVAHSKGVLVIDAEDREDLQLAGHVRLPGIASNVALDRERRLIFAAGGASGIYVIDFDALPSVLLRDENGDGIDDRVLEKVTLTGNTNSAPFLLPELGLAYAGGLNRGLTSVAVAAPRIGIVAENRPPTTADPDPDDVDDPRFRPIRRLAPLGVPTAPESPEEGARTCRAPSASSRPCRASPATRSSSSW